MNNMQHMEDRNSDNIAAQAGKKKKHIIAIVIICIVVIAAGTLLALYLNRDKETGKLLPDLETGAEDWEGARKPEPEKAPEEGIRIPGFKSITIEANTTEVSVNLHNPEENKCYFVIRLVLSDTGETLYESKMIEPGKGLYSITLSRPMEPGTYSAQLQYEPYDMETLARLNGAVINLDLIAE
jgi:flagellar basal body-associated protein FliL